MDALSTKLIHIAIEHVSHNGGSVTVNDQIRVYLNDGSIHIDTK